MTKPPLEGPTVAQIAEALSDECHRLREINAELLAALRGLADAVSVIPGLRSTPAAIEAYDAIAKAEDR